MPQWKPEFAPAGAAGRDDVGQANVNGECLATDLGQDFWVVFENQAGQQGSDESCGDKLGEPDDDAEAAPRCSGVVVFVVQVKVHCRSYGAERQAKQQNQQVVEQQFYPGKIIYEFIQCRR